MRAIAVVDYGVGNIGSLATMLESLGYVCRVTSDAMEVRDTPLLLLPGVGSAATAMRELGERGLEQSLRDRHAAGMTMIGICLGAQLMFSDLVEAQGPGLALMQGTVSPIVGTTRFNTGWCQIEWQPLHDAGLVGGLRKSDTFYFNHQYALPSLPPDHVGITSHVVHNPAVPALHLTGRLCGIQFHPEKSQASGRRLMKNILDYLGSM